MKKIFFLLCSFMLLLEASNVDTKKEETKANPVVIMKTTKGDIEIELFPKIAPKAVENFLTHAKNGYYNGTIFHRVIERFMIQGGDPTGTGMAGESIWGKPFEDEFSDKALFDKTGQLAMANSGPNTNGSQFFITTAVTHWLNGGHTIFGQVKRENGMLTVRAIEQTAKGKRYTEEFFNNMPKKDPKLISYLNNRYSKDLPKEDIKIISIELKK